MTFSARELSEIIDTLITVNTPLSLLRWLERFPAVSKLSTEYSESALLDEFRELLSKGISSEDSLATAYAILVAIILLRRREKGILGNNPIPSGALSWSDRMWIQASHSGIPHSLVKLDFDLPKPQLVTPSNQPLNFSADISTKILVVR
jgi:hypothetical protein